MAYPNENQIPCAIPLKVHINPNFRGKSIFTHVQESGDRPAGIHFNPHWKPKNEGLDKVHKHVIPNGVTKSISHDVGQRRTIHINPKLLPIGMPQSISDLLQREHLPKIIDSTPVAAHEGGFKHEPSICINPKEEKTESFPPGLKLKKSVESANSPTIRSAKIVRSKYKYLNNSLPPPSAYQQHFTKPQSNYNAISTMAATSFSRFKYVKNAHKSLLGVQNVVGPQKSHVSQFKLVKCTSNAGNSVKLTDSVHALTPNQAKSQRIVENVKNMTVHTGKPRYKLSKNVSLNRTNRFKSRPVMFVDKPKSSSRYKFVRQTEGAQRTPLKRKSQKAMKSRYKIVKGTETETQQSPRTTRYRVIRNVPETSSYKPKVNQPFQAPFCRRSRWVWSGQDLQATKVVTTNRKLLRIGRRPDKKLNRADIIRKAKLLNIGGVFYRSTRTTLTRSTAAALTTSNAEKKPHSVKGQILSIRGSKFVLDKSGKTLQRLTPNKKLSISRIHIGGVTFVPSSENTLVLSRVHEARNLVSLAKQRSIAVLTSKLRKNNQPCLIYQRLGKCRLHDKERCPKVHDPKKRAICKDFVNGKCLKSSADCQLSHDVGPEKMPTCHFFLEGCCVRDPCPYSHVKLSKKAAVCREFLSGYCSAGEKCKERHVFLCPEYEETKRCTKGKYCTYRHGGEVRHKIAQIRDEIADRTSNTDPEEVATSKESADPLPRYYQKNDGNSLAEKKESGCRLGKPSSKRGLIASNEQEPVTVLLPERLKLGDLPGYIPL